MAKGAGHCCWEWEQGRKLVGEGPFHREVHLSWAPMMRLIVSERQGGVQKQVSTCTQDPLWQVAFVFRALEI